MPFKDPARRREYQRSRAKFRRAGDAVSTPASTRLPAEFVVRTAADVLLVLDEQVAAVRADPGMTTGEKARTIAFLANTLLRAIEVSNLAGRFAALEAVLKARG